LKAQDKQNLHVKIKKLDAFQFGGLVILPVHHCNEKDAYPEKTAMI
jgi:hypothetical protein